MMVRHGWLVVPLLCLSCQTIVSVQPVVQTVAAGQIWERGQIAMHQGHVDEAIRWYEQSLLVDPQLVRSHLSLAAAYLEKGDLAEACPHLAQYVDRYPNHIVVRAHYAELLMRLERLPEARGQFEQFIADAQSEGEQAFDHLIHSHSRLMDIAEASADDYGEHLHRGIGLYLLACERARLHEDESQLPAEGLFCKAAAELMLARLEKPRESRPCWYLYEVWSHLGQRQPAQRCLNDADREAPFTYLTPTEQCGLHLACQQQRDEKLHRSLQ